MQADRWVFWSNARKEDVGCILALRGTDSLATVGSDVHCRYLKKIKKKSKKKSLAAVGSDWHCRYLVNKSINKSFS